MHKALLPMVGQWRDLARNHVQLQPSIAVMCATTLEPIWLRPQVVPLGFKAQKLARLLDFKRSALRLPPPLWLQFALLVFAYLFLPLKQSVRVVLRLWHVI
jgi:hypothetical protein